MIKSRQKTEKNNAILSEKFEKKQNNKKSIPRNNQNYNRQETTAGSAEKKTQPRKNQQRQKPLKKITNPRIFMKLRLRLIFSNIKTQIIILIQQEIKHH